MANITIPNLPSAIALNGSEQVEVVQSNTSVRTTTQAIANLATVNVNAITSLTINSPLYASGSNPITSTGSIGLSSNGVTNNYLGTMPTLTLKGNNTGSTAAPTDLSVASVMTMLGAAPLASPTFTGTPRAPTPATSDNSTQIATTAFVKAQTTASGTVTSITAGTGLSGGTITAAGTIALANTTVTAFSYGSASSVPTFTVNAQGQLTAASNTAIAIASSAVSGLVASATIDATNATNITTGTLPSGRLTGSYTGITGVGTLTAGTWNAATVNPGYGGTGLSSIPANGQLLIGNGAGYTLGTLTAGPGVSITNAAGSVTIGSLIGQQSFFVQAYVDAAGSVWNASTDNTAPINACIAAASAAGGGTVVFPVGRGLALGAIVVPYAGTSGPTQVPLRLTGSGPTTNGYWNGSPNGGTILDLRYSGGGAQVAAIDTRGAGFLQIDNTTIVNGGSGNYQFFQTTNTTVHLDRVTWVGNSANSGTACVQNAILLGGNTSASSTLATNASTAGFQGYGSRITNCYFEHINVAVGFGGSANGVYLDNNTVSASCGSSASHGAPYVFYGAGLGTGGNVMNGGIVEITHYPYAVSMIDIGANNTQNYFFGLGSYDETMGSPTVGAFYFSANSIYNMVVPGFNDPGLPILNGPASASNSVMGSTIVNWSLNKGATFAGQLNTTAQMGVGNSNPQQRLDVGSGASFEAIRINGGNSGNGSGSAIEFSAGGSLSAYLGFYSGYGGGTYNSQMYFPTTISFGSSVAIGQTSGASPRVALDVGDGTGAKFASVDGAASGTGTGAGFEVRNGGAVLGFFGNQSAYTGGSYSATMLLEAFNGLVVAGNGGTYLTLNSGVFQINAGHLGFYGSSGLAQPTITGSKGGNAALASLLTYLAAMGLVVDSTT